MHDDFSTPYIQWEKHFELGIPHIDQAHEEMFNVMNRVYKMVRMGGNVKWTVAEAIKFFRAYAIRHFEEEEAFMLSVGYTRYSEHRDVHEGMRCKIIPRLHSQLEDNDYSEETVAQFLRIWEKWLNRHILGHDRDLVNWVDSQQDD